MELNSEKCLIHALSCRAPARAESQSIDLSLSAALLVHAHIHRHRYTTRIPASRQCVAASQTDAYTQSHPLLFFHSLSRPLFFERSGKRWHSGNSVMGCNGAKGGATQREREMGGGYIHTRIRKGRGGKGGVGRHPAWGRLCSARRHQSHLYPRRFMGSARWLLLPLQQRLRVHTRIHIRIYMCEYRRPLSRRALQPRGGYARNSRDLARERE